MESSSIEKLSVARQMLAEAKSMDDILHIRDIAEAARVYAQAAKLGLQSQNEAAEIKIRAERKAGEMLTRMPMQDGGDAMKARSHGVTEVLPPTLAELGIEKMQSSRWQQIAKLPEQIFEEFITETKEDGYELTSSGLIREAQRLNIQASHSEKHGRPLPDGKFKVIYADPPWAYDNSGFNQSAASHYPTMTTDAICDLAIEPMTDETTTLFMWATSPLLPDAFRVIAAWGFDYKASMIWVKNHAPGIGWWVQTQHEILLIASNGSNHPVIKPPSVIIADSSRHSQKPEEFYEIIERMYPGESKIELFARNTRDNWTSWGNENV